MCCCTLVFINKNLLIQFLLLFFDALFNKRIVLTGQICFDIKCMKHCSCFDIKPIFE